MKTVFKVRFVLKWFLISAKECFQSDIQSLEKGLDFAPIRKSTNEPKQRKDFGDFTGRMQIRRNFRDELSKDFFNKPAF